MLNLGGMSNYSIIVISMVLVSVTRGFRLKRNLFYYSNIQQAVTS